MAAVIAKRFRIRHSGCSKKPGISKLPGFSFGELLRVAPKQKVQNWN